MTLAQVKAKLEIPTFELNRALDKDENPTAWYRHWDNENRRAISIHEELLEELKTDNTVNSLALQSQEREGSQGKYMAYRIVKYTPAEVTL